MRGCADLIALVGIFALLVGGAIALAALTGDCTGFACLGQAVSFVLGSLSAVVGVGLLLVVLVRSRRR